MKIWDHFIVNQHDTTFLKISKKSKFTKFSKFLSKFSQNLKKHRFAVISETVRDRAKQSEFWTPDRVIACKITNFEIFGFTVF